MDAENQDNDKVEPSAECDCVSNNESFKINKEVVFWNDDLKGVGIHCVKFNYNDKYVAAGYRDGFIRVFNMLTRKPQPDFELNCNEENGNQTLVQVMKWRPKIEGRTNNILMAACRDTLYEYHVTSKKLIYKKQFTDNTIFSLDFSNNGEEYAVGFKDCSIRGYDGYSKKEKFKLGGYDNHKVTGHMSKIYALKYHKDNEKILISGGWDGNVLVWDLNTEAPISIINGPMISGEGIDMNPFGEILTASWRKDNPLQLWDANTYELKKNVEWNNGSNDDKANTQLYCAKFSNDFGRNIFAGGSQINAVKVFDWCGNTMATISGLSHAVVALDSSNNFSKNENFLAVGGGEGAIRVFRYTPSNPNN